MTGTTTGAVLAVGDELLLGDIVNSNAAWLGEALARVGVAVVHSAMVGDDVGRLATALRRALEDADVVVLTGGLGPTSDDLTRDAVALVADAPLERSAALEQQLRDRFESYGMTMPAEVLRQADVPRGAQALDNPVGSAPGLRLSVSGRIVVALPGPPHEMRAVAQAHLLPELAGRTGTVLTTRTLRCAGIGESAVAERIEAAVQVPDGVDLAYLAGSGVVRVRFTTAGDPAVLLPLVEAGAAALGDAVFGRDDETLPAVVGRLLRERGQTVASAESLTGGLVGAALSELPGSSLGYRGGLVVYATDAKATVAGVPDALLAEHGAVSEPTALALAVGARDRLGADWGVATTGVAGPDEQEGKPVGTVHVAVAGPTGQKARSVRVPGDRDRVRVLATTAALDLLRRALSAAPPAPASP
ncbi:MAG TPA: competence/damage-inducible protein A [Mycobacteriales bacterium]|jgi:nicotinamide-nucleotide amidase|nr:competence/damage-inducible protein A [Mycobacteriales bacterium]